jgi:hypothetical protein
MAASISVKIKPTTEMIVSATVHDLNVWTTLRS